MPQFDVISSAKYPIDAALTPKAGSKFLMNLFYYIDNGAYFDHPADIRTVQSKNIVKNRRRRPNKHAARFVLFRHPADRFAAFYFGDIYGGTTQEYANWRNKLSETGFDFDAGMDVQKHQRNAFKLLALMEEKIDRHGLFSVSDSFSPQVKAVLPARDLGFSPFEFRRASIEIAQLLRPFTGDMDDVLSKLMNDNLTKPPIATERFVHGKLATRLREIYAVDYEFYEAVHYGTA